MPTRPSLAAALLAGCVFAAQAACPPDGWDNTALQRLRGAKFEGLEAAARDALARRLLDCLADPRPDLLLQLGLNPALSPAQLDEIVQAVASQVAPAGEHFYVYGEPERLARRIVHIAKRATGRGDSAYWERWLAALAAPAPLSNWDAAFKSQSGLARRHNTQASMQVLYAMVRGSGDATLQQRLLAGLVAALKALP
jgi:hypothetical protein